MASSSAGHESAGHKSVGHESAGYGLREELFDRAKATIPGGVNSPVRSFRGVGGIPYFVKRAKGAHVITEDGQRYLDYVQSYGPNILGHGSRSVQRAVKTATKKGFSYGAPTLQEVLLAEKLCGAVQGMEMVRLVSSGTEATMSAIRLARGATGRDQIIKFAGCYHGHGDALLAEGGSGVANQGISGSAGVTDGAVADTIVAPYNQVPELTQNVAAVIVEPVAANMGVVAPAPGFLAGLRKACDEVGALLIFDEIITGFRIAWGGAVEVYGVLPDLWCFGKVIGGGLPLGAYGGRTELMNHLAPLGEVYQAGTLSGNPIATAAGLATLGQLSPDSYKTLKAKVDYLAAGLQAAVADVNINAQIVQVETLLGIFFGDSSDSSSDDFSDDSSDRSSDSLSDSSSGSPSGSFSGGTVPSNFDQVKAIAENGVYPKFFHQMLARNIAFAPGAYEAIFVSLAHTKKDLEHTISQVREVFKNLSNQRPG